MAADDERCADSRRFDRLHAAFETGDLDALRAAVDDPGVIPNGPMPATIGSCLVYAIYHSPLAFIRELLALGADPNAPADDGFPPLIAALTMTRAEPGVRVRHDVDDILRLLLSAGADPNGRGINDWTALHMAVAERNASAIAILLEAGADPGLRTRIDDCETPLEMAETAGLRDLAALIAGKDPAFPRRLRSGLILLMDVPGAGAPVRRQRNYRIRLRLWLRQGDPVRWQVAWGRGDAAALDDHGATLTTVLRIDRRSLINGLFYGIDGMRVGGIRRLEIAPHLAYGDRGVPGTIPPAAVVTAEIAILEEVTASA